jgi:DNA-binding transcriptional regulator YdaS (Cro superfamily)
MDLKIYLESRNIEHKEFAKMILVTPTTISNYIAGRRRPNIQIALRIEKVTNGKVTIKDLLDCWEKKHLDPVGVA